MMANMMEQLWQKHFIEIPAAQLQKTMNQVPESSVC